MCDYFKTWRITSCTITLVLLGAGSLTAQGSPAPDDPLLVSVLDSREDAESLIAQGDQTGAVWQLIESLRNCPSDRPEFADAAYANVQLAVFTMEYLMSDTELAHTVENQLTTEVYPTDKLIECIYNIFIGQETEGKTRAVQEMTYLTASEHELVKVIALFNLSDPYFYRNEEFTSQRVQYLATHYPDLELTHVALNLAIQEFRKTNKLVDAKSLEELGTLNKSMESNWSSSFRGRVAEVAENIKHKSDPSDALGPLRVGALAASNWQERYSCLLMLEDHRRGGDGQDVRPIASELALRENVTPDVLRARILLARLNGTDAASGSRNASQAKKQALHWAKVLLDTRIEETTPERTVWEDRMKAIRSTAKDIAQSGNVEDARSIYEALAKQFPSSLVSEECAQALLQLEETK